MAIFIDAEKAFDTVWLDGLRKMLHEAGIPITVVRWLSSFLQNRQGQVRVNNSLSKIFPLRAGVPQGSILAPLLYIFFIKGMPTKIREAMISSFYADDTSYAASDNQHKRKKVFVQDLLQPILTQLEDFCSKWRITLNPAKTWCVNFHNRSSDNNTPRLYLRGELLKYKQSCKFLGITFDNKLTFKEHIEDITSRCKKRLNILKALRGQNWGASPETILYTYKSYIRPILEYSAILFAYADQNLLTKIQAVETLAIKIAHRLPPWTTNTFCYSYVSFENIIERIRSQSRNFLQKNESDELINPSYNLLPLHTMEDTLVFTKL